ncbi:MAG: hypothetical protein E4H15_00175 [Syntrophobacterales bacterium]|nr:MAG: hypothetical protein E4H15_00175 [Syntrophobacterales bacterium]
MSKKDIIVTCLALLVFSGCVSGKMPEVTKRPAVPPQDILGKIAMPDGGDTIRATVRISLSSPEGDYSRKMALLLRMPSSLRIETIPLFGPADFFLSANEETLKVFFPGEGKFYVGAATRENLFLFFKVFLSPADMVPLLAGLPPRITGEHLSGHMEGMLYRIDIKSGKGRRSLWVDPDDHILTKIEDIDDGRTLWRATFTDHIVVSGTPYPRRVHIEVREPGRVSIDIRYLDLDISSAGDTAIFDLRIPSGITPIPIDR